MRRYLVLGSCALLVVLAAANVTAQTGSQLHIAPLMTPQEMQATGIAGLSSAQRAALDQWLDRYTQLVIRTARSVDTPSGAATRSTEYVTGRGHWVDEVSSNGAIVTLEDNSMWEITSVDQVDTALWLPTTNITVMADPRPIGDYKYILVNTEDGEKARAKYMGKH